jgi:hypothetical protein
VVNRLFDFFKKNKYSERGAKALSYVEQNYGSFFTSQAPPYEIFREILDAYYENPGHFRRPSAQKCARGISKFLSLMGDQVLERGDANLLAYAVAWGWGNKGDWLMHFSFEEKATPSANAKEFSEKLFGIESSFALMDTVAEFGAREFQMLFFAKVVCCLSRFRKKGIRLIAEALSENSCSPLPKEDPDARLLHNLLSLNAAIGSASELEGGAAISRRAESHLMQLTENLNFCALSSMPQ